jgi:hypothetical protein
MDEISHHEIALYFLVTLPDDAHPDLSAKFHCEESGTRFEFAWHRVDALGGIRLVPGFLIDVLSNLADAPQHVVHVDDSMLIMARAFYRPLHIEGLAVLIKEFPCKRARRRLGRACAMRGCLIAQASLDLLPELAAHYRLVLPRMAFLLVTNFAEVDRVR